MARVLVAITDDTYVRNYLRSDALTALRQDHRVFVIADRALALAEEVEDTPGFLGFYDLDPKMEKRHHFLFNLMMWRHRRKSRTFFYRWLRNSNWHLIRRDGSPFVRFLSYIHWFASALVNPRGLIVPLLANRFMFRLATLMVKASLGMSKSLKALVESQRFDVILFPSAAFDSVSVDLVALGQELNIPTVCLIDNWDNLSSKTVFWRRPDHLGVWGPQTKKQAIAIHGFSPEKVHIIGTPRFDSYFAARQTPQSAPFGFPYGLYLGSAMPFDDIGTLKTLDAIIATSNAFPKEFQLVYRPHPWQQRRNSDSIFRREHFSKVILDPQFEDAYHKGLIPGKTNPSFQPDLDYYPGLLWGSSFVVGPLTTMLLEASLCLKPVVALSFFDGFHANTSQRYFSHFDGMERVPGFVFCADKSDLEFQIQEAQKKVSLKEDCLDAATSYFILHDAHSYGERLTLLISEVCARNPPSASFRY